MISLLHQFHLAYLRNTALGSGLLTTGLLLTHLAIAPASPAATLKGDTTVSGGTSVAGQVSSGLLGRWLFSDFSTPAVKPNTQTTTTATAIGSDGQSINTTDSSPATALNAEGRATANALFTLTQANTEVQTGALAIGAGTFGASQSTASVPGRFQVDAGELFSFNFQGFLGMGNAIVQAADGKATDSKANAQGNLSLLLYDITDTTQPVLLDFLDFTAQLNTPGDESLPNLSYSNNFKITNRGTQSVGLGSFQESLETFISGSFQRRFAQNTVLAFASTSEPVPEPSTILASIACGAAIVGLRKRFAQENPARKTTD